MDLDRRRCCYAGDGDDIPLGQTQVPYAESRFQLSPIFREFEVPSAQVRRDSITVVLG